MRFMSRKRFLLPESDILATETTQRLKAGILARIYLIFFWCTVVWQHDSGMTPSAKTGFKVNDGLWFGTEAVHHHGMGGLLPHEISLIEQRTRLTLCQGDTVYHGGISERPKRHWKKLGCVATWKHQRRE